MFIPSSAPVSISEAEGLVTHRSGYSYDQLQVRGGHISVPNSEPIGVAMRRLVFVIDRILFGL